MQITTTSASDLIAQSQQLEAQKQAVIAALLKEREESEVENDAKLAELRDTRKALIEGQEKRLERIAADLKALGYVRPRTKAETTGIEQGAKKRKKAAA